MRTAHRHRAPARVGARDDVAERALLHHHGRGEDQVGPVQVAILERRDVHVHQPELVVRGEHRRHREQAERRHRGPLADQLEGVLEAPVGRRELRIDQQDLGRTHHGTSRDSKPSAQAAAVEIRCRCSLSIYRRVRNAVATLVSAMSTRISPLAGKPAPAEQLRRRRRADRRLLQPAPGSARCRRSASRSAPPATAARSFDRSFNEAHVLAITPGDLPTTASSRASTARCSSASTRTRCPRRRSRARSRCWRPTASTSMIADGDEYTPTPAISHAILAYNRGAHERARRRHRDHAVAQPARQTAASSTTRRTAARPTPTITGWIEAEANALLASGLDGRAAHAVRAGAARADHARARLPRRLRRAISAA